MKFRNPLKNRVVLFWRDRLPNQEPDLERFLRTGITLHDHNLSCRELVGACSLMLESHKIYQVHQAIHLLINESTENRVDDEFFAQMDQVIAEMERAGMRTPARKLRKFGQGLASVQGEPAWQTHWENDSKTKQTSAIKDEPFLPQRG